MAKEKITVQIDDEVIELKGEALEAFLADRAKTQSEQLRIESEMQAQKELKITAYTKLGLTEEEINAIL